MGKGGIHEVKRDGIVDDAAKPCRGHGPASGTAGVVEPDMDDLELPAEPLRRHRDPHPHRKLPLYLAAHSQQSSYHVRPMFTVCSNTYTTGAALSRCATS